MKKSILTLLCIIMMGTVTSFGKTVITVHYDSGARQEMVHKEVKRHSVKKNIHKRHDKHFDKKKHIKKHHGQHSDCKKCLKWHKHHRR